MGVDVERGRVVNPENAGPVNTGSDVNVVSPTPQLSPSDFSFTWSSAFTFLDSAKTATAPNTPQPTIAMGQQFDSTELANETEPVLPIDFPDFELSPEASTLTRGNLDGVKVSFSEQQLPASLFDNPDIWKYEGSDSSPLTQDLTWEKFDPSEFTFGGVRKMGDVIFNAIRDGEYTVDPKTFISGINYSYGSLFDAEDAPTSTGERVKDRSIETNTTELAQNVVDAVMHREPFFHETSGEARGRAYLSRIENTLKLLQEGTLDLNDPEVKKMVVAIARQLYSEAALEPNLVLPFYEMLRMGEYGRDITPEQFEQIVSELSPDELKTLLDGSIVTLRERLVTPPKAWVMNKNGVIADEQLETLRGEKGATPREVLDVVTTVWSKDELIQAETRFYEQTGYHTDFYENSNHYNDFDAGIAAIEARSDGVTGNSSYVNTVSSSSIEGSSGNIWTRGSALTGSISDVLHASGELIAEENEAEEEREEDSGGSWFTSPLVTSLAVLGSPDTVIDTTFKTYISVDDLTRGNPASPVILSSTIEVDGPDDSDV